MLEWLIIGGGIHGTYLSNLLLHGAGVPPEKLRVLDPYETPLAAWRRRARACGMPYLRSPATHNIDLHILAVHRFARSDAGRPYADFIPPYFRPSVALFDRHCDHVIQARGLDAVRIQTHALDIQETAGGLSVQTQAGPVAARRVVLALGPTERLCWPAWAASIRSEGAPVHHVFDPVFRRPAAPDGCDTVILGGGITAVQLGIALAEAGSGRITLISRHPLRIDNLDFDPCWIGPKCLGAFVETPYARRREIVDRARHRGTVPEETAARFNALAEAGRVQYRVADVREASYSSGRIRLATDDAFFGADRVILATGFSPERPGGLLTDRIAAGLGLATAACGYPILDAAYRWHPRIFVTGALAELRGGPCTRNIVGARNAGREILKAVA